MPYSKIEEGRALVLEGDEEHGYATPTSDKKKSGILYFTICAIFSLAVGSALGIYMDQHLLKPSIAQLSFTPTPKSCIHPIIRREWRSFSMNEKHDYLNAVRCLKDIPSRIGEAQSLYDDFPWIHYRIGDYCKQLPTKSVQKGNNSANKLVAHHAAAFLAWHRIFIHTYERALQEDCGYQGHLA